MKPIFFSVIADDYDDACLDGLVHRNEVEMHPERGQSRANARKGENACLFLPPMAEITTSLSVSLLVMTERAALLRDYHDG